MKVSLRQMTLFLFDFSIFAFQLYAVKEFQRSVEALGPTAAPSTDPMQVKNCLNFPFPCAVENFPIFDGGDAKMDSGCYPMPT